MLKITVTGVKRVKDSLDLARKQLSPGRAFGRVIRRLVEQLYRFAVRITEIDTGAWRGAHYFEYHGLTGMIGISPYATNPRTGVYVEEYASIWEERGGRYAVYLRTIEEMESRTTYEGIRELERYIR